MAKLYGIVQGHRGIATRCGSSRMHAVVASLEGAIAVTIRCKPCGSITYDVSQIPWGNSTVRKDIDHGVLFNPNQEKPE